jgi:hypothetical protein
MNRDYSDLLSALSDAGADFLLVGAHAMASYGYPRFTKDMDVWIRPSPANAERVISALKQFGAPLMGTTAADLSEPDVIFQIGVDPVRIDVLTFLDGVDFEDAWARREYRDALGVRVPVLAKADLIRNKRTVARPQDLVDAERLEAGEAAAD